MNINASRYMDSIGANGIRKDTFLNRWHMKNWNRFYAKYEREFEEHSKVWTDAYDRLPYQEFRKVEQEIEKVNPTKKHWLEYFFCHIPSSIEHWLCCGFKVVRDENVKGGKTFSDKYHMLNKLCRYETWPNVKITFWDRLRFKWITGFTFE